MNSWKHAVVPKPNPNQSNSNEDKNQAPQPITTTQGKIEGCNNRV